MYPHVGLSRVIDVRIHCDWYPSHIAHFILIFMSCCKTMRPFQFASLIIFAVIMRFVYRYFFRINRPQTRILSQFCRVKKLPIWEIIISYHLLKRKFLIVQNTLHEICTRSVRIWTNQISYSFKKVMLILDVSGCCFSNFDTGYYMIRVRILLEREFCEKAVAVK